MAASPSGWALRKNGTCELQEVDCGETVTPYRVCCPHSSSCPHQYNANCCPTSANCTQSLLSNPTCANSTWDLYDNDGYFCCLPGYLGYAVKSSNSNGCAGPGYQLQPGEVLLRLIRAGVGGGSISGSGTSSTTGNATPVTLPGTSEPTPSTTPSQSTTAEGGGLSTGAQVGIGVGAGVGGLVVLAVTVVFLRRWRRRHGKTQTQMMTSRQGAEELPGTGQVLTVGGGQELPAGEPEHLKAKEMDGRTRYIPELGDGHHHELEGDITHPRVEVQG